MSTNRKPAGAKMSKGRTDTTKERGQPRGQFEKPARPRRGDTGEARQQREGVAKTHPTRNPIASRKAPREMPSETHSHTVGSPAPVRRGPGRKSGVGRGGTVKPR